MSNNAELINDLNDWNKWIEEAISKKLIKYYEFDQFYNFQNIGSGGFGRVYRANWKNSHKSYAIKSFFNINDASAKAIVREIQLQREVDFHDNVISFYGVTTSVKENQRKEYSLLVYAVSCLHGEGIMHRDLHSNNVKSDVYSIGVLLWEISSGKPPFHGIPYDVGLAISILQGFREKPIPDTSEDYIKIYTDCWNLEPDNRPTINQVVDKLRTIITKENIIIKDFHLYDDKKDIQLSNNQQPILDEVSSEDFNSLHGELSQVIQNFNMMNTKEMECSMSSSNQFENKFNTIVNDIIDIFNNDYFEMDIQKIINYLDNHNITLQEFNNLLLSNQNDSNFIALLGRFNYLGIGISVDKQKAFELYQKAADLENSFGINFLAYHYEKGIETNINSQKAFELYQKAADLGYLPGINNLGRCYENGIGTNINQQKAFELYQKAADLGSVFGIIGLGHCYENGIGTDINQQKIFELYQKAADLGNAFGINNLGYCYEYGIGTNINQQKAFELYQKAADLGSVFGIIGLGHCYENGIGTDINQQKTFELYQKAADLGNAFGINNLGYCYENGIGTNINQQKAFELYQKAADLGNVAGI
ncbi:kinase-like domain-containing protein [Rhizophagus irregularis DAOM 181602=DAOM 197198]|nr:kinase-like domain-containing protein [Rhizophagus irregularis DAOM 181602=DAOM 197198]